MIFITNNKTSLSFYLYHRIELNIISLAKYCVVFVFPFNFGGIPDEKTFVFFVAQSRHLRASC